MRATKTMAVAGLAALGMFTSTTAAHAAGGETGHGYRPSVCPGSPTNSFRLTAPNGSQHPNAKIDVYYSSANGGTRCAVLLDNEAGSHDMRVFIGDRPYYSWNYAVDVGHYTTYAGPVAMRQSSTMCLWLQGRIQDNGTEYTYDQAQWNCG